MGEKPFKKGAGDMIASFGNQAPVSTGLSREVKQVIVEMRRGYVLGCWVLCGSVCEREIWKTGS